MNPNWFFPFIAFAGVLQAAGAAMNGALNKSHGCEGSSKLIHPVDECPVPDFNQEWKLL